MAAQEYFNPQYTTQASHAPSSAHDLPQQSSTYSTPVPPSSSIYGQPPPPYQAFPQESQQQQWQYPQKPHPQAQLQAQAYPAASPWQQNPQPPYYSPPQHNNYPAPYPQPPQSYLPQQVPQVAFAPALPLQQEQPYSAPEPFRLQPQCAQTPTYPARPSSARRESSRLRSRSRDHHHHHHHHHHARPQSGHKDNQKGHLDTFVGAGSGALIGDLIFPGLGTVGGALLGGYGGHEVAKKKRERRASEIGGRSSRSAREEWNSDSEYEGRRRY